MPLYEYHCSACHSTFELLRDMAAASEPAPCGECGESTHVARRITSFVRIGGAASEAPIATGAPSAGGCCGGACGCH
ncbi:MAG TPA: zinc ribbon domain-containing protein [Chloroflexota bacterium]|nr:zinc ribbon domain-containing protein [Chloroflexota bacterium]